MNVTPEFASPIGGRDAAGRALGRRLDPGRRDPRLGPDGGPEPDLGPSRGRRRGRRLRAGAAEHGRARPQHRRFLPLVDGVIVGSDLKLDGGTWNPVDRERVRRFLAAAQRQPAMLLGLDVGTTAVKAVLLDPDAASAPPFRCRNAPHPAPGRSERGRPAPGWNALAIVPRVCAVAGIAPDASPGRRRRLRAVRVPAGRRRQPLRPAMLYNDAPRRRARSTSLRRARAEAVLRRTGAGVTQQSVGPKLRWLRATSPSCGRARDASRARTTGSRGVSPPRRTASGTGRSRAVSTTSTATPADDLCAAAGASAACCRRSAIPANVSAGSAPVARRTGLRAGIPVVVGRADHVSPLRRRTRGARRPAREAQRLGGHPAVSADRRSTPVSTSTPTPSPGRWLPNGCMASGSSACAGCSALAGGSLHLLDAEAAAVGPGAGGLVCCRVCSARRRQ